MAGQEYKVRITAETKQATDKIDSVQNSLSNLTTKSHNIQLNLDANAVRSTVGQTNEIAANLRSTKQSIQEASGFSVVSSDSLTRAAALASTFYGIRKDVKGIHDDMGRAVQQTNVSEFMRTNQFLDRVLANSKSRTREIVETYQNIRELPGTEQVLGPVENFARAKAWETYGDQIAGATIEAAKQTVASSVQQTKNFFYGDIVNDLNSGLVQTIDTLSRVGLAIQGVQLLVGPLAAAWSAAFDAIIGQNIRLEQTILSTQTTLASTGRVIDSATGVEITDPLQKINALEGGVRSAIDNIRIRSLDLAGVTSQQIIEIFGVVATSISQVNGNLQDAEDLAISFTAALGTLGIPFYQARQEIGSILGGYITEDSLLAKRLQISNQDIQKAKSSVDGVVGYLQKKLETAVAGQAIQAKGFAGVTSNIQEVFEVLAQSIGEPLLQPLIGGLTTIYEVLKKVQGIVAQVGQYLTSTVAKTITNIANVVKSTKLAESIGKVLDNLAEPYKKLAFAIELGLGSRGRNLLQEWLDGTSAVPAVMEGLVSALRSFGNFLQLQIELISTPITRLIDQSRELADGSMGIAQRIARIVSIPFGNFIELDQTFTKGWDTLTSTIQEAGKALSKFALTLVQIKITAFTAQVRAAADVFEVFGSVLLGRINLALAFFDTIGNVLGSDLAKFVVSMQSINALINSTDFFGIKGIAIWAVQTRQIFQQLIGDAKLFVKGFKEAGNINNLLANAQGQYAALFSAQTKSKNPVVANAAELKVFEQRLQSLTALQAQMAAGGAGQAAMDNYGKAIASTNQKLLELKKTQESFTKAQRAGAALQTVFGSGKEIEAAKEAARQASVLASGAASAQALSGALDALRVKLGMSKEEFRSLGGAAKAAGKSIQTFITTTALINIGFTALSLVIAAGVTMWQQYEERVKAARIESMRMATVNKIINSGWSSVISAAAGGDVASQQRLDQLRSEAQAAISIQQEKQNKLAEEYRKKNDEIYKTKVALSRLESKISTDYEYYAQKLIKLENDRTNIKKQQLAVDKQLFDARKAAQLLVDEEQQVKNFDILAERRKDLESKIQQIREDFTKEVTDKEFQVRMESLSTEQQIRREMIEQEKAAVNQRFQILSNSSTDQEAKAIALLQRYKTGLLEAVQSEEQRRTDMQIKQEQMRKAIEDYAFKMTREKIRLEKELGGYQKQMEQYKTKQAEIRTQKEINAARQTAILRGPNYEPISIEQQQKFVNASQSNGVDHRYAFAALNILGKDMLRLNGTETPEFAIAKLKQMLDQRSARGMQNDIATLAKDYLTGTQPSPQLIQSLMDYAVKAFNTGRWLQPQDPASLAVPELKIDYAALQQRVEAAEAQAVDAMKRLQAAQAEGDKARLQQTREAMRDPANITDVKLDYASEIDRARVALQNLAEAAGSTDEAASILSAKLNEAEQVFRAMVRGTLRDASERGVLTPKDVELIANELVNSTADKPFSSKFKELFFRLDKPTIDTLKDLAQALNGARARIPAVSGQLAELSQITAFSQATSNAFGKEATAEITRGLSSSLLEAYRDQVTNNRAQSGYSFENVKSSIVMNNAIKQLEILTSLPFKPTAEQLKLLQDAVQGATDKQLQQASVLDAANNAVAAFQLRSELAMRSSRILSDAYKTLARDALLSGASLKDVIANFGETVSQNFVDMFLEYAMKPMEEQLRATFSKVFGVEDAQKEAARQLMEAASALKDAANAQATRGLGGPDLGANTSGIPYGIRIGDRVGDNPAPRSLPVVAPAPISTLSLEQLLATEGQASLEASLEQSFKGIGESLTHLGTVAETTSQQTGNAAATGEKGFGKFLGAMTGVATGALAITGAIQAMQDSESGTYGTLMGIAGVLGGLGSIFGGISSLGKRAGGGPISADRPYIVGELGPELIIPGASGTVIPNDKIAFTGASGITTEAGSSGMTVPFQQGSASVSNAYSQQGGSSVSNAFSTINNTAIPFTKSTERLVAERSERETVAAINNPKPLDVRFESQVINGVEYVTAEQHQKGMAEAAERGRTLTLSSLQNSLKARRQAGLA